MGADTKDVGVLISNKKNYEKNLPAFTNNFHPHVIPKT
jgi:hypothetical protein